MQSLRISISDDIHRISELAEIKLKIFESKIIQNYAYNLE